MKKKILIISAVFPPEQVTSALMNYDLAVELAREHEVTVLRPFPTRPVGTKFDRTEIEGVEFKTILIDSYTHPQSQLVGRFRESIDFGKKCASFIKKHHKEIDYIYNCGWQLFGIYIVAKAAKKYSIPYMIAVQDIYPESLLTGHHYPKIVNKGVMTLLGPMDRYYQRNAYRIRTISDEMASYLSETRKVSKEKFLIVNNWQNDEDFVVEKESSIKGILRFAYVGSINMHSNTDLIIRAFHKAQLPNAELYIYGGGNRKEYCVSLVKDLNLTNVHFDMVARDVVPTVQGDANVLVLALPKGNGELCLPSKITSYMLSGRPILASVDKDSATTRYLKESGCGVVVDADNEKEMSEAFKTMAQMSENKLLEMGRNARNYAGTHLTKSVNLKKVVESIKESLDNKYNK